MTRKRKDGSITRAEATPEQLRCWDCLSSVVRGDHHLGKVKPNGDGIAVTIYAEVATFDDDLMTRLVLAAHRDAVRISIASSSGLRLKITAHPRRHGDGQYWQRHPSLTELAAQCSEVTR